VVRIISIISSVVILDSGVIGSPFGPRVVVTMLMLRAVANRVSMVCFFWGV